MISAFAEARLVPASLTVPFSTVVLCISHPNTYAGVNILNLGHKFLNRLVAGMSILLVQACHHLSGFREYFS